MIEVKNIHKSFGELEVLKGVNLKVQKGEIVAIVGKSGAGKTTLLQIIGTLDTPTKGKVLMDGIDVFAMKERELAAFRNKHIGFIFQFHQLLPEFTALENVCIPAMIAREKESEYVARATKLLQDLGLGDRLQHKPNALSGGEKQRVAAARALMMAPDIRRTARGYHVPPSPLSLLPSLRLRSAHSSTPCQTAQSPRPPLLTPSANNSVPSDNPSKPMPKPLCITTSA